MHGTTFTTNTIDHDGLGELKMVIKANKTLGFAHLMEFNVSDKICVLKILCATFTYATVFKVTSTKIKSGLEPRISCAVHRLTPSILSCTHQRCIRDRGTTIYTNDRLIRSTYQEFYHNEKSSKTHIHYE